MPSNGRGLLSEQVCFPTKGNPRLLVQREREESCVRTVPDFHLTALEAGYCGTMLSLGSGGAKSSKPSFVSYVTPEVSESFQVVIHLGYVVFKRSRRHWF